MSFRAFALSFAILVLGAATMPAAAALTSVGPQLHYAADNPVFAIEWSGAPPAKWENLFCAVKANGEWKSAQDFPHCKWTKQENAATSTTTHLLEMWGLEGAPAFTLELVQKADLPYLVMTASALAGVEYELGGFEILAPANDAGFLPLNDEQGIWTIASDDFSALSMGNLARLDSDDPIEQGCWIASVQNPRTRATFAFAQLRAEQWPTWFSWDKRDGRTVALTIRAGGERDLEAIRVPSQKKITSDPVLVGYWTDRRPQNVLLDVAKIVAEGIKRPQPMRRPDKGWSSWHYFFRNMNEEKILQQADALKERFFDDSYKIVQLDGGWWKNPGEFTTDPAKFPMGLEKLSDLIRRRGLKFGLHMSPFRMDRRSDFWKDHEGWNVGGKEAEGAFVLDGSNPAVIAWMKESYAKLAQDTHVSYFKFDFINQGAKEGKRHNPEMTGLQAYNTAIRAIREAVPPQIIINGCNALSLGAVECFDTLRVGPDINHGHGPNADPNIDYANMEWGEPTKFIPGQQQMRMTLMNQVRAVARQFYVHNNIAIADMDSVLVTPHYTLDEARCHATLVALTGGTFFLGDRLDTLPADRAELVTNPRVMAIWEEGKHAIPVDLFDGLETPRVWKVVLKDREVIGIFNWTSEKTSDKWGLDQLWLNPEQKYAVKDVWSDQNFEVTDGTLPLEMPAHSVRLFEFRIE